MVLVLAMLAIGALTTSASAAVTPASSGRAQVRSGLIHLLGCDGVKLIGTARLSRSTVTAGQQVRIEVVVRNEGRRGCRFAGFPGARSQEVGLCGAVPLVVRNSAGIDVFPDGLAYSCPMKMYVLVPGGQSFRANGVWQSKTTMPDGRYQIVLGGRLVLPIVVD